MSSRVPTVALLLSCRQDWENIPDVNPVSAGSDIGWSNESIFVQLKTPGGCIVLAEAIFPWHTLHRDVAIVRTTQFSSSFHCRAVTA